MVAGLRILGITVISTILLLSSLQVEGRYDPLTSSLLSPVARFEISTSTLCLTNADTITITDNSEGVKVYAYNFGTGAVPQIANNKGPHKVTYTTGGPKTITLSVEDASGKTATFSKVILVYSEPGEAVVGPDTTVCTDTALLVATPVGVGVGKWELVSGTGTMDNEFESTTTIRGISPGANVFKWTVSNGSCTPKQAEITVSRASCGVSASFQVSSSSFCLQQDTAILVSNSSVGIASYNWNFGVGASPGNGVGEGPFSVNYSTPGAKAIQLTAVDSFGISHIREKIILVVEPPSDPITRTDTIVCADSVVLAADDPISGVGSWSLVAGEATFSSSQYTEQQSISDLAIGDNLFEWRVSSLGCKDKTDTLLVRRDICLPPPSPQRIVGPEWLCADTTALKFWVENLERTDIYNWTYPPNWEVVEIADTLLVNKVESGSEIVAFSAGNRYGISSQAIKRVEVESCIEFEVDTIFASLSSRGVHLSWNMNYEKGVTSYTLERSLDGVLYQILETQDSEGDSNEPTQYQQIDHSPIIGTGIYRVKMTGRGGNIFYTDTTSFTWDIPELLQLVEVYPNPLVTNTMQVSAYFIRGVKGSIFIVNSLSSVIWKEDVSWRSGLNEIEIDVSHLPPGVHFLCISALNRQEMKVFKIIKLPGLD
ncbi:MAG: hypothetical protein AAF655_07040 [Bacteroidota bacterium]